MKKFLPIISIALLLALLYFSDFGMVAGTIIKANITLLIPAVLVSVLTLLIKIIRWKVLVTNISLRDSAFSFLPALFIANFTPARIGEPVRSYFLKRITGHPISSSLPRVIIERVLDISSLIILSIMGILLFGFGLEYPILGIAMLAAFIVLIVLVLRSRKAVSKLIGILLRLFSFHKKARGLERGEITEKFYNGMRIQKRTLLAALLLSLLIWILEGLVFYLVMVSLNIELPFLFIVAVFAFSILMGTISFLPGGIGSTEFVFVLILSVHIVTVQATAGVILGRFLTFWLTMFICGIFWKRV